jgi:hypothetical protein
VGEPGAAEIGAAGAHLGEDRPVEISAGEPGAFEVLGRQRQPCTVDGELGVVRPLGRAAKTCTASTMSGDDSILAQLGGRFGELFPGLGRRRNDPAARAPRH